MKPNLVTQPTGAPTRKVTAAAMWGLLAAVVMAVTDAVWPDNSGGVADVLAALEPFVPVIASTVGAYMTRERAS